jgi:hypothetical protein
MEWQLPIQKVEIGNINIGSPWARESRKEYLQKPMAPLSYFGTHFRLPFISLLFPALPVVEYSPSNGRLVLDMSETSLASIKLSTFQDTLVNAIVYHQYAWFKSDFTKEEIRAGFQPMFQDNHLILHCPSAPFVGECLQGQGQQGQGQQGQQEKGQQRQRPTGVPLFKDGVWRLASGKEDFAVGSRIRVSVKIHGISFLNRVDSSRNHTNLLADAPTGATIGTVQWSGRCRLQHRILGIIAQTK